MIVKDLRPAWMWQFETVWIFEVDCMGNGTHRIDTLSVPLKCSRCGVEAVERERRLPG